MLDTPMIVRTNFPRFQEYFYLILEKENPETKEKAKVDIPEKVSTAKMYVGKYFTAAGEFDEEAFKNDTKTHINRFVEGKYIEFNYNHKSD